MLFNKTKTYTWDEFMNEEKDSKYSCKFLSATPIISGPVINLMPILQPISIYACAFVCGCELIKILMDKELSDKEITVRIVKTVSKYCVIVSMIEFLPLAFKVMEEIAISPVITNFIGGIK